ncbi:MAG TPA: YfiR family protein [Verrucomicrobiaceae bacterium]
MLALSIALPLTSRLHAQSQSASQREYEIKAAYLYNFINYVAWPADALPGSTITLGIVGENPFGAALNPLNGKKVKGRTLAVRQVSDARSMGQCQIVFFSSSEKPRLSEWLDKLKDSRALTVSEVEGFAQRGGIINFISEHNKVRFEINPASARERGLTISSELLKLANVVKS